MANINQDSDFLTKNSSRPSREPCNLPSDEEFFSALIDYRQDVSSTVDAPKPMAATPDGEGWGRGPSDDGCSVRLDPAWFELDLSLSDLLQVIRMEHQKSRGRGKG